MNNFYFSFFLFFVCILFYQCKEENKTSTQITKCIINSSNNDTSIIALSSNTSSHHVELLRLKKEDFPLSLAPFKLKNRIERYDDSEDRKKINKIEEPLTVVDSTDLNFESTSSCHSLKLQLETQLDSIKKIQKIASISTSEEGYREARSIKNNQRIVFFKPTRQKKGNISFRINLGTVGFVHSHTLSDRTRGFYSFEDVKIFLLLSELTYNGINAGNLKSFTMYDLYSTLIYGNQIYSMKIDDLDLYKKFYNNEKNIKIKMNYQLNKMYQSPHIHFNFFKSDYKSDPDENQEALNALASRVLSKIGIRIYRLENYDKKNKEPRWRKLLPSPIGNGLFVNPC